MKGRGLLVLAFLHDTTCRYTAKYRAQHANPGDVPRGTNVIGLNCRNRKIQCGRSLPNNVLLQLQQHRGAMCFLAGPLCALPGIFSPSRAIVPGAGL